MKIAFSPLIAGCMTWGSWGKDLSRREMSRLVALFLEMGIDTFDHADIYGGYTTEAAFGKAWKETRIPRGEIRLISKCGIQYPVEARPLALKHYDYSARHIHFSVEQSLRNLQTDYLDLLLLHRPSPLMRAGEIAETILQLQAEGKIRDFGLSNFTTPQTDLIAKYLPVAANQIRFSLTHWEPMIDGSLDHMQRHDIVPMAWNPLGEVFRQDTPQTQRISGLLKKLEEKYAAGADVLLLSWILRHPAGIVPVCGTTSPERIGNLMRATTIALELEDWFALWVESRGSKVP